MGLSPGKDALGRGKVVWRMHLLQNVDHAVLRTFLLSHLAELVLRDGSLLVPFLQLFMHDKVLCHDARDLLEVVENCKSGIFNFTFRGTKTAVGVIQVERSLRLGRAAYEEQKILVTVLTNYGW